MTEIYFSSEKSLIDKTLAMDLTKTSLSAYNDEYFSELVKKNLTNASNNDEFYSKLVELKNEQKKTLLYMQELYNQKQTLKEEITKSEITLKDLKTVSNTHPHRTENYKYDINTVSAYENRVNNNYHQDSISIRSEQENADNSNEKLNVSKKPPLPHKVTSSVTFQTSNNYDNNIHEDISEDLKRIEKIWNDFNLEDDKKSANLKSLEFNKRFEKKLLNQTNKSDRKKSKGRSSIQYEWFPRVTIPEPFSMTIREQLKSDNKHHKLAKEMQEERDRRIEQELRECSKSFKATPVPAHVYLPLYEKHKLNEELRKDKIKKSSKEYMDKVMKPFNLTKSVRERRHSYSEGRTNQTSQEFSAQPLPEFYFNDENMTEKMKEYEIYKQLKKRIRAIELLKKSKLPHNMELQKEKKLLEMERDQYFISEMNRLQQEMDSKNGKQKTKRKSYEVPDYDELYRNFVVEFERKRARAKKNTKVEPFNLSTTNSQKRINAEEDKENRSIHSRLSNSSMTRLSKSLSMSMDALPSKNTQSQNLRESVNREKVNDIVKKELQKEHIEKVKKIKEKKLHDQIQEKIKYDPKELDKKFQRQTRKLKLDQKEMEERYEQHINDLNKSVETRKLQIEQYEEQQIKKAIEKKYQDALKKAGINEIDLRKSGNIAKAVVNNPTLDDWINE